MRKVILIDPGPPLTLKEINAFENEIGGCIPDDYKEFLLANNGGFAEPRFSLRWKDDKYTVPAFYSLLPPVEDRGIRRAIKDLYELNPMATSGYLPITSTYNGEEICLATRDENFGAVFITDYTYKTVYTSDLVPIDVKMAQIADSFTEFLNILEEIPDPYCRIVDLGERGMPEELTRYLAEGNSIDAIGKYDATIICEAIKNDNIPMIKACIEHGANLSGTMEHAVSCVRTHLIEMLVEAGADINERDEIGLTPLHFVPGTAFPGEEGVRNRELYNLLIKLGALK